MDSKVSESSSFCQLIQFNYSRSTSTIPQISVFYGFGSPVKNINVFVCCVCIYDVCWERGKGMELLLLLFLLKIFNVSI